MTTQTTSARKQPETPPEAAAGRRAGACSTSS